MILQYAFTALPFALLVSLVHGIEIANDMVNSGSSNLISYTNAYTGAFSSQDDGFQKYSRSGPTTIPSAIRDDSLSGSDSYGIVDENNLDEFFGIADTINSQNSGVVTAEWEFDVDGYVDLSVSIDMAAMGNFESSDYFKWFARFDTQTMAQAQEIFSGECDTSDSLEYTLASGATNTLSDPLEINNAKLSNVFQPFISGVSGTGSVLKLTLEAKANSSNEAMAFQNIRIKSGEPVPGPCSPDQFCGSDEVTTMSPGACDPSGLTSITLASHVYNSDTLVELLGPADPADGAAIVISAPHGGDLKPNYIPDRSTSGPSCPDGCKTSKDTNTLQIALELSDKIIANYCKVPYVVVNQLHRSKLDANREIGEAAQGETIAEDAWWAFHNYISDAQTLVEGDRGTETGSTGLVGVKGLLFDIHGYAGYDWDSTDGGAFIQWGYRLSASTLDPNNYCPLDVRSSGDIGTYTHARWIPPETTNPDSRLECLVRGPASLGARVPPLTGMGLCGAGLPSVDYPSPEAARNDCAYCEDMCGSSPDDCHFYSGGYDVDVHEYIDWEAKTGVMFNTVQAELPRCIRFNSTTWDEISDSLSIAMCSFVGDLFDATDC